MFVFFLGGGVKVMWHLAPACGFAACCIMCQQEDLIPRRTSCNMLLVASSLFNGLCTSPSPCLQ